MRNLGGTIRLPPTVRTRSPRNIHPVTEAPAPDDRILAALARIEARLDRVEQCLARTDALAGSVPATLAAVTDTIDEHIAQLTNHGVDVDDRIRRLVRLVEPLTRPETIDALRQSIETLREVPAMVATVADTVDGAISRLAEQGIDVDERLQIVARVAERLTAPEALAAVRELLGHVGAIQRLLESGIFAPGAVEVVDRAAGALADMDMTGVRPVGAFGAIKAMRDPCIQRSLGALVEFGRRFGRTVHTRANTDCKPCNE